MRHGAADSPNREARGPELHPRAFPLHQDRGRPASGSRPGPSTPSVRAGLLRIPDPCLIRRSGNDAELVRLAVAKRRASGAGHSCVAFLEAGFPVGDDGAGRPAVRGRQAQRRHGGGDPRSGDRRNARRAASPGGPLDAIGLASRSPGARPGGTRRPWQLTLDDTTSACWAFLGGR